MMERMVRGRYLSDDIGHSEIYRMEKSILLHFGYYYYSGQYHIFCTGGRKWKGTYLCKRWMDSVVIWTSSTRCVFL